MFINRENILEEALGFKYNDSIRVGWRLKDENMVPVVKSAISVIEQKPLLDRNYSFELIKEEANRQVFRMNSKNTMKSYIFKVFPLQCLRHRLKYYWMTRRYSRFAYGEAVSLLIASRKGLNVPDVYGYGYIRSPYFLIEKSVLILEDLSDHKTMGELLKDNSEDQGNCLCILNRSIPFFVKLYEASCNHISVNSGALMLNNQGDLEKDFIIDFEYARFNTKPSLELVMYEAATLANYCRPWISDETRNEWLHELLNAVNVKESSFEKHMTETFNYYLGAKLTRKERMKIGKN